MFKGSYRVKLRDPEGIRNPVDLYKNFKVLET